MVKVFLSLFSILLFYLFATFPFEVPDEQSHYASVHFLVQEGRMPTHSDKLNLSKEEVIVERILGTMSEGENKYLFHPEYRIEQIDSIYGKYEAEIKSANTPENKKTYLYQQAAIYPPLYYLVSSVFYRLVEQSDFIVRLFMSRVASLIFTLTLFFVAYKIGQLIFEKESYARLLAFVSLMFPMTTYLSGGVNSDTLHNVFFASGILLSLKVIKYGLSFKTIILMGVVFLLDLATKPQAYILLPTYLVALILAFRFEKWLSYLRYLTFFLILAILILFANIIPNSITINKNHFTSINFETLRSTSFQNFLKGYIHTHLAEMPVWYWGVFKWMGVILPRFAWWPAIRLFGLGMIGTLLHFYRDLKEKKFGFLSRALLFAYLSNLIYIGAIFLFDWQFYQVYGHSLGLQARYYLPVLIMQMFILVQGLLEFGWNEKTKKFIRLFIIFFFVFLQLIGLYTQLSSYYDLWPPPTFINQISQYKPPIAKGSWWYLWIPLYLFGIICLTHWVINPNINLKKKK